MVDMLFLQDVLVDNDYSKDFFCASKASQTIVVLKENEIEMIKDIQLD